MNLTEQDMERIEMWLSQRNLEKNKRVNAWAKAKNGIYEKYKMEYEDKAHKLAQGAAEISRAVLGKRRRSPFTEDEAKVIKEMLDDIMSVVVKYRTLRA